jgi:DNA-binding beta-propeller fold protein YncE
MFAYAALSVPTLSSWRGAAPQHKTRVASLVPARRTRTGQSAFRCPIPCPILSASGLISDDRHRMNKRVQETCANAHGLSSPVSLAVSPDGTNVYLAAFGADAVARFNRAP